MKPLLEIQHIGKRFSISSAQQPYLSLRDSLTGFLRRAPKKEDFWALRDVTFDVQEGDTVGIVGKNGAGKSTLLKILSRITPPTTGRIVSRGRIASLMEVGTGFHPELTGRENVYMNGSILGMRRREIDRNFDAIIDFAGVERFLDTPLKHYSSGMQLRLAFAVAAFLENEILIIDEVLAVGDAEFQKKCLNKMGDISLSGRTILFVSHNTSAIETLCRKCVLLEHGTLIEHGLTSQVLATYGSRADSGNGTGIYAYEANGKPAYISGIELRCDGKPSETFYMGCAFELVVHFSSETPLEYPILGMVLYDQYNTPLMDITNKHYVGNVVKEPVRAGAFSMSIPGLTLTAGTYNIDVYFANLFSDLDNKKNMLQIKVEPMLLTEAGELLKEASNKMFIPDVGWKVVPKS